MHVRKTFVLVEEIRSEAMRTAPVPLRKVAAVAVVKNPLVGAYHEDLAPLVDSSVEIGRMITEMAIGALGSHQAESYGKAAVVGLGGEQEHGVAMLTTVFGAVMRESAGGGLAWIPSFTKRAAPGAVIDVPLAHKDALYVRSHYDGMSVSLHDAPLEDEIAVICVYANRGRLNHRVGGLRKEDIQMQDGLV